MGISSPPTSRAQVAEMMATSMGRRALSEGSPAFFDTYYCGMRAAPHRSRWLKLLTGAIEDARSSEAQRKNHVLLLAPRDHGKTEVAVTLATREVVRNRDIRILWISESITVAKKRLSRVKALMLSEKIREDWTEEPWAGCIDWFEGDGETEWKKELIRVQRHRESVDPTIEVVGIGGAVTGGHFDLIICDDLESDKTTYTAAMREKNRAWFRGTVLPMLSPGGSFIIIGTRKHHDDLYGHLIADPMWRVIEDPAISQWPESFEIKVRADEELGAEIFEGVDVVGPSKVLWPQERPIHYLLAERHSMGSLLFSREFQHQVVDESSAPFKMDWLNAAKARGANLTLDAIPGGLQKLEIVQGWDLSLVTDAKKAASQDSDFTVGITWARDAFGDRYLLGIRRERGITPGKLRGLILEEFEKFGGHGSVSYVAVERNSFGELQFMGLQRTTDLPLKGHLTTSKKADPWDGVPSLRTFFENGKVIFPSRTEEDSKRLDPLIQELWGLGKERHDDTVMALWIAETVLRDGGFVYRVASSDGTFETGGASPSPETGKAAEPTSTPRSDAADAAWRDIYGMVDGFFD